MNSKISRRNFLLGTVAAAFTVVAPRRALCAVAEPQPDCFVHPGGIHTQADLDRMAAQVAASATPWIDSWNILVANPHSSLSWRPRPVATVIRGGTGQNYSLLYNDTAAAYACALRWYISGDTAYADKAVEIMNAWSSTLRKITGTSDKYLAAGIYGYQFANAAEIMRLYSGWDAADFAQFQNMMLSIFYPMNHDFLVNHNGACISHYWCNWDACNMASMISLGVLCDSGDIFNEAVDYYQNGAGNGSIWNAVYYIHPENLGQWQESGRDQQHNMLGLGLLATVCEVAWSQGIDLYGYADNRLLTGAEYIAQYNLGYDVPYVPYNNCDNVNQTSISPGGRGGIRPIWEQIYNHYVNRKGLSAPYTQAYAEVVRPEGGGGNYGPNSGGYDHLGYGTLTFTLETGSPPFALAASPDTVDSGDPFTIQWTAREGRSVTDWIGLYHVGDPNTASLWWAYTGGATSGSFTPSASDSGQYEFDTFLMTASPTLHAATRSLSGNSPSTSKENVGPNP